jgi:hypothetical protein
MLVSNFRVSTRDVDAVVQGDQAFCDEAVAAIADRRGWPRDWLNDGVRTYLSPRVEGLAQHELCRAYPTDANPGVRVFVPTAEYMLAMKLMAMRIDPAGGGVDLADILSLMAVVGLRRKEDIVDFAAGFYPEARISGKLALSLDALWRAKERRDEEAGREPPRYLDRGGPAR